MSLRYKAMIFLSSLGFGVIAPVLSLLLTAHGCPLGMIGLAFGAFAITVIAAEIPSGVFADLYGRKTSFVISCALSAISCAVLLVSRSFLAAMAGLMLFGLSAAFSSGSMEALIVDEMLAEHGKDTLEKTVSRIAVYQCAGIAVGALLGGYLPNDGVYTAHLLTRFGLALATGALALAFLQEGAREHKERKGLLRLHLKQMGRLLLEKRSLTAILFALFVIAATQGMVEIYWQPRFVAISGGMAQMYLGYICAGGFVATTFGCALMGRAKLSSTLKQWAVYIGLGLALAGSTLLLALQKGVWGFAAFYIGIYFIIGLLSVPEQTIVNSQVTDDVRASMLSVVSFFGRAGAMVSSAASSALLLKTDIGGMWGYDAVFTIACLLVIGVLLGAGGLRRARQAHAAQQD